MAARSYEVGNMFDYFKDRRFVPVFLIVILALAGVILLTKDVPLRLQLEYLLPPIGLLLFAVVLREILHLRAARRNRYKSFAFSRDELAKARSKLKTNSNIKYKHGPSSQPFQNEMEIIAVGVFAVKNQKNSGWHRCNRELD